MAEPQNREHDAPSDTTTWQDMLSNLSRGQTLYVFMTGTSQNMDPFVALLKPGTDITTFREDYLAEEKRLVNTGRDLLR